MDAMLPLVVALLPTLDGQYQRGPFQNPCDQSWGVIFGIMIEFLVCIRLDHDLDRCFII